MPARYFDFRTDSLGAVPYRWAVLRFEFSGPFLLLFYEDSSGFRQNYSWPWTAADLAPLSNSPWGTTVQANIVNLAMGLPDARPGPHNTGPVPIAVFFSSPYGLDAQAYETQLWDALSNVYSSHTQIARLADKRPLQRSPLQLPIRILAADGDSWLSLQQLLNEWWCSDANISKFGLQVDTSGEELESALIERPAHIVVTHSASLVLKIAEARPEASRPRLVIHLDENHAKPAWYPVPRGVAFLRLAPDSFGQITQNFIRSFVAGVVHDLPIHEAVKAAVRLENPPFIPRLIADPISNQSLRLSEALLQLKRETESFSLRLPAVLPHEFFERVSNRREPEAIHLRDRVAAEFEEVRPLTGYVESRGWSFGRLSEFQNQSRYMAEKAWGFAQESEGLQPMASMLQSLTDVRLIAVTASQEAQRLAENPETALLLRKHQERFVDVAMSRLETEPLFSALAHQQSLAVNTRYELRVHIGNPQPETLVTGERRPIDPLLPDTVDSRGHELEVSIQGKEFEVVSTTTQKLWLPEIGGSGPIYFEVRTPDTPSSEAQLRICVYHRNHMVQSYLLTARIDGTEAYLNPGEQAIGVKLEFSRTERFANLDELRPRLLSVGANRSNGSTTHKLNVKADGVSEELTLFASTYDAEVKKFRAVLQAAAQDPINPAIPRTYPIVSPGQQPASDVADTFRTLARQGSDLFDALFRKADLASKNLRKSLEDVQRRSDQKLQVVCFDDNFVFPWSLLYDFLVPEKRRGISDPPICLGVTVDAAGNVANCSHSYKDRVFCVRGFWGVRHYIEEILGNGTLLNPTVSRASQDPVRLVYDSNLPQSATLLKNLQNKLGANNVTVGPTDPDTLIDLLWDDPPKRPSILIVLAHLDTDDPVSVGEPEGERIVLEPQNKWLTRKMISEHIAPKWAQPRSIVLLMVCDSAAGGVEKVNTFVSAWDTAGAGAIVGTECIVGSQLAADFAEQLAVAMWKNSRSLGEATTSFRRQLTSQGNPLAFLFRAVGDIDLTVQ